MANTRIIEMQIKQIIRLSESGYSIRRISKELGLHRKTIRSYLAMSKRIDIELHQLVVSDDNILQTLGIQASKTIETKESIHFEGFLAEQASNRKKPGFTVQNMYQDYIEFGGTYSRTHFYRLVKARWDLAEGSVKLEHKFGNQMFVDYSGKKLSYINRETGEQVEVEVLVTILPASQYIYVEAMVDQKQNNFVSGIINALEFIGGTPKGIVCDNLKSGVTKAGKYQSTINKTLQGMALHYETTIDPTRPYHPKDKAMVEGAVKIVYQQIFYNVNKHKHFSLSDINKSIRISLIELNNKRLTGKDNNRTSQYEQERPHLQPLPQYRYELKEYRRAKVQKMGYVYCGEYKNYYSVPYRYIGKKVELRYDCRTMEIYYGGNRIANHITSQAKGGYVTNKEHLSSNNKAYTEWTPEYFSKLASEKGQSVQKYIDLLIEQKPYPEQAYRQAQGILALCRQYETSRVESACELALQYSKCSYNMIKQIIENKKDQNQQTMDKEIIIPIPRHENVRGSEYYV